MEYDKYYINNDAPADNTTNVVRPMIVRRNEDIKARNPQRQKVEQQKANIRAERNQRISSTFAKTPAGRRAANRAYTIESQRQKQEEAREEAAAVVGSLFKPFMPSTYVDMIAAIKNGQVNDFTDALAAPYLNNSWSMRNPGKALVLDITTPFIVGKGTQLLNKSTKGLKLSKTLNEELYNSKSTLRTPEFSYEISSERVPYTKYSINATNPSERQIVINNWNARYPNSGFRQYSTPKIKDGYLEVGELPLSDKVKATTDLMSKRWENFEYRPQGGASNVYHWWDSNGSQLTMKGKDALFERLKQQMVPAYMPLNNANNYEGFYSMTTGPALKLNPWRTKPYDYSQLHESISHITDDIVKDMYTKVSNRPLIKPVERLFNGIKSSESMYGKISYPEDIFGNELVEKILSDSSRNPKEARAMNWEMIQKLYSKLAKDKNISYNDAVVSMKNEFEQLVDNLSNEEFVKFMKSFDNKYLDEYSKLMENGTKEQQTQFIKRIKNAIKYGASVVIPTEIRNTVPNINIDNNINYASKGTKLIPRNY